MKNKKEKPTHGSAVSLETRCPPAVPPKSATSAHNNDTDF